MFLTFQMQPVLHHLLILQFLGVTVETLFAMKEAEPSFGTGPWPCLNRAGDHYGALLINRCQVSGGEESPVGKFTRALCEFAYVRSGPDLQPSDRKRADKILNFGPVWEERLKTIWRGGSRLAIELCPDYLGVDLETIQQQAGLLGLPNARPGSGLCKLRPAALQLVRRSTRGKHRDAYCDARAMAPDASRTELASMVPGAYAYLNQKDRVWLEAHKPPKIERRHRFIHEDPSKRDAQLAAAVADAADKLRSMPGKPRRVCVETIKNLIGHERKFRHIDKWPLTAEVLDRVCESTEAIMARRILWLGDQARANGRNISEDKLLLWAGAYRGRDCPQVRQALDQLLGCGR